jgi:hypothetical protein
LISISEVVFGIAPESARWGDVSSIGGIGSIGKDSPCKLVAWAGDAARMNCMARIFHVV